MAAPETMPSLDFGEAHLAALRAAASNRRIALPRRYAETLAPFAVRQRETGRSLTFAPDREGRLSIDAGEQGAETAIALSEASWAQLEADLESAPGLVYGERVECLRGDLMSLMQWEPALRWLFTDRPVYDPRVVDLRDASGRTLDPTRSFTLDDDRDEMAEFLRVVGYVWVRNVLSADEVAGLRAAADSLRATAFEGDQESWWGRRADGEPVLSRVLRAGKEPAMRALHGDPRLESIAALSHVAMEHKQGPEDKDGVTVLWKQPGIAEGLGDLPWHRDCGMGGHASMCPTGVLSVFLGENTEAGGQIRFLPGSWQCSFPFAEGDAPDAPRGVAPAAKPGDVTFHYGDGLHVAPPPTSTEGRFRSCVLMGYGRVGGGHHAGGRHYNDVLLGAEDGQVQNMRSRARRD